ncbi:hypothetical protein TNCV_4433731 [Trichonephila clavipes]|nr:hypothetical protein TNCV_4433731 [Trichonephila clavipes]
MLSLRNGNAIETLPMTAPINTDLVTPVPLTTHPSTSLVHVGTDTFFAGEKLKSGLMSVDLQMIASQRSSFLLIFRGASALANFFAYVRRGKKPGGEEPHHLPNRLFKPSERASFIPPVISDWEKLQIYTRHPSSWFQLHWFLKQ